MHAAAMGAPAGAPRNAGGGASARRKFMQRPPWTRMPHGRILQWRAFLQEDHASHRRHRRGRIPSATLPRG